MKNDLIKQLKEAYNRVTKALHFLPNDGKHVGDWSKKEILSHLVGWYEEGVDATPKILKGEKPNSFRMSINGYNKRSIEKRKHQTIEQIQKEGEALHNKWIKQINALHENQITEFYGTLLGKKPINLLWMIHEGIAHDNSHAEEIEKKFI